MAKTVSERVRKYRAKKSSTEKGREELLAINRKYKRRHFRKKEIARLIERRSKIAARFTKGEIGDIIAKSRARRVQMLKEKLDGKDVKAMTVDQRQELDLDTLNYEIKMLRVKVIDQLTDVYRGRMGASGSAAEVHLAGGAPQSATVPSQAMLAGGPPQSAPTPSQATLSAEGVSVPSTSSTASAGPPSKMENSAGQLDMLGDNLTPTKTMDELYETFKDGVLEFGHAAKEGQCERMRALVSASVLLHAMP